MQGMDFSTCPTASAPQSRATRPALAGPHALNTLRSQLSARLAQTAPPRAPAGLQLPPGQTLRLQARAGQMLTVRSGRVWATLTGWPDDRWLDAGQSWVIPADGRLVIEASGRDIAVVQC